MLRIIEEEEEEEEESSIEEADDCLVQDFVLAYIVRQLCRRGMRHSSRLTDAVEVAIQNWTVEVVRIGSTTVSYEVTTWRPLADRAVYQTLRELRPLGRGLDGWAGQIAERNASRHERVAESFQVVSDLIETLPTEHRLIVKLKMSDVFLPGLLEGQIVWQADEAEFLLSCHPGIGLASLKVELLARLRGKRLYGGKVPSAVIAWLLGRAGGNAVDTAYLEIKHQLRSAVQSNTTLPHCPGHSARTVLLIRSSTPPQPDRLHIPHHHLHHNPRDASIAFVPRNHHPSIGETSHEVVAV